MPETYPRWFTPKFPDRRNLRIVGRRLFVGGLDAPPIRPPGAESWALVVDCCGGSVGYKTNEVVQQRYARADRLLRYPFDDGEEIPEGFLQAIVPDVGESRRRGPVLIHCAAGMSRSVSVAYACLRVLDGVGHAEAKARVRVADPWPLRRTFDSAKAWAEGVLLAGVGPGDSWP